MSKQKSNNFKIKSQKRLRSMEPSEVQLATWNEILKPFVPPPTAGPEPCPRCRGTSFKTTDEITTCLSCGLQFQEYADDE